MASARGARRAQASSELRTEMITSSHIPKFAVAATSSEVRYSHFDPLDQMKVDPSGSMLNSKANEVKNGRQAMLEVVGSQDFKAASRRAGWASPALALHAASLVAPHPRGGRI